MTYFRFHLLFNVPVLIVLTLLGWRERWDPNLARTMELVILAAVLFTTPWDNLAVRWGIWGFPRNKYSFKLGYLPIEEYAFFVLQSLNVMLLLHAFFHFHPDWHRKIDTAPTSWTYLCLAVSLLPWVIIGLQLRSFRRRAGPHVNYALHLVWFLPVIYAQWVLGPDILKAHLGLLILSTGLAGIFYTVADVIAVRSGVWNFDEKQITGIKLGGVLPWEEIAFFFLTSLLVAQSYLLLLPWYAR